MSSFLSGVIEVAVLSNINLVPLSRISWLSIHGSFSGSTMVSTDLCVDLYANFMFG